MSIYLQLLLIVFIVVNLIDLSGFIREFEQIIAKKWKVSPERVHIPKPFSCSYCMSHHVCLLVLLCTNQLTLLTYAYVLLLAFLTPNIASLQIWVRELITKIDTLLNKLI